MTIAKFLHGAVRSISLGRVLALVFGVLALSVTAAEARPYRLIWDRNLDGVTTGYRVYYGTSPGAYQPASGIDVGNVQEFTADLTPGVTYFFVVRAYSSANLGPPSAELIFTVPLGASINLNTASVAPGTTITASVTDGPGNRLDWVGFFPTGALSTGATDWKYLNGSRTAPATGITSATVSFVAPSTVGTYVVRFYSSSNVLLASSITISVNGTPTISAPSTVSAGQTIAVAVANGPATRYDMVALYPSSSTSTSAYIDWKYLNGSQVAPATGIASANVNFTAPAQAGQYFVRFMANNGASVLASSGIITVTANTAASVTPNVTTLAPGSSLIAQVRNGPAGRWDWVGLFAVGASNSVAALYLNGSPNPPATGMSSADVPFTAPQQAGQYNLRFFNNNGATPIATSVAITVTSVTAPPTPPTSTAPTVTSSVTSVPAGGSVTVQVRNGPRGQYDWLAMYPVGGSEFVDWFYLNGTKAPPSSGIASADIVFPMPKAGQYRIFLFQNGYSLLASTAAITVTNTAPPPPTGANPSVTPSATFVARGSLITVTVANGPGLIYDWVTMYASGQTGANFAEWAYLNGTKTPPSTGFSNATFSFKVPMTPGTYVLRFQTNSYTLVANSVNIVVY